MTGSLDPRGAWTADRCSIARTLDVVSTRSAFLLHHATWSVNSICHMYGRRPFATKDESRDNWLVALVSFGEGWHHSHHAFPTSARHGLRRTQIDPSYAVIRLFEKLGLVWNVKRPKPEQIAAKRVTPGTPTLGTTERQAA